MKLERDDLNNAGAGLEMLRAAHFSTRPMLDDGWRIPDAMWQKMKPLLPPRKVHPLGCHNPRVPNRDAMNAILLVLRTGCKWTELDSLGLCSHSAAHRRFQEWVRAGVFEQFRIHVLLAQERLRAIDWGNLSGMGQRQNPPSKEQNSTAQKPARWPCYRWTNNLPGQFPGKRDCFQNQTCYCDHNSDYVRRHHVHHYLLSHFNVGLRACAKQVGLECF